MRSYSFIPLLLFALPLYAADKSLGKTVFTQQCASCHSANSAEARVGPGLKGLFKKAKLQTNGQKPNAQTVQAIIDHGAKGMPPYDESLTPAQKTALLAYLKSL